MDTCTTDAIQEAVSHSMKMMGVSSLKAKQQEAIISFMEGKDVFVSLPTGYGKSMIYCLLPLIFDRLKGM